MIDWLIAIEGTSLSNRLAILLALLAAMFHAFFGSLQKGKHDPWFSRGAIDLTYGLIAIPFVLFIVPYPEPHMWLILFVALIIHSIYKILQASAYSLGSYTVVYPIVRGSTPLFTIIGAYFIFNELFSTLQLFGVFLLLSGIFGLAFYNLKLVVINRDTLVSALSLAVLTGFFVALYTNYDTIGIRATYNPFTFIFWLFLLDSFLMPFIAYFRWYNANEKPNLDGLVKRGLIGGVISYFSFGSIMMATRLGEVGQVAVLRETSTVFAVIIGVLFLNESMGLKRLVMILFITLGAVCVGVRI